LGARKKKNMPYQLPRTTTKAEFSKPGESLNSFEQSLWRVLCPCY